jgi:hypothetical protein
MKNKASEHVAEIEAIDSLNQVAWKLRVSDSNLAFNLSQQALRRSLNILYEKGRAEGLRTFGFCHIRLAKYDESLELLKEAYQLFSAFRRPKEPGGSPRIFWHHSAQSRQLYRLVGRTI